MKYKFKVLLIVLICFFILYFCICINYVVKLESEENTINNVIITDETKELVNSTIEDTQNNKDLSTTEIIEETVEEETIEEELIEPDAQIEQENISWDGDFIGSGTNLLGAYQGLIYYNQSDSRWANIVYSSTGDLSQTLASSGCGPTAAAMVVSSSKGTILPTTMANIFVDNGYRTANNGTAWSAFSFVADYFGFNDYANTSNLNTALDYLRKGYYVIVSVGNGLFTTGGHYIVLVGIDEDTIQIYDPLLYNGKFNSVSRRGKVTVDGNSVYCSVENFMNYANYKNFWVFSNDNGSGNENNYININYSPGSYRVVTDVLNVRLEANINSKIVTKLYSGSMQGVDYTEGVWGHLINNAGWISLEYCEYVDFNSKYLPGSYTVVANVLNVRNGASINSGIVNKLYTNSIQGVDYTLDNWGHLINNAGWICLDYCEMN